MRECVFIDNARIYTRVNSENHNTPTGLAAVVIFAKEKVQLCRQLPGSDIAICAYTTPSNGHAVALRAGYWCLVC